MQLTIESGCQRVLDEVITKGSKLNKVLEVVEHCYELDIKIAAFYVIGFPGETKNEMKMTTKLAIHLFKDFNVLPILLFATPLYGTYLYNYSLRNGIIKEQFSDRDIASATQFYGNPMIETDDFSKEDLKSIAKDFEDKMNQLVDKSSFKQVLKDRHEIF